MKRPAAPDPGPSPKQRNTVLPPRTPMGNPVEPDVLPEDPETRALHRQHWQSIRTEEATGNPIQELYNFTLHEMTASTFPEMVRYLYRQQTTAFKINLSFGFILRNIETGVLRYYHSSENNARFFDVPYLIRTEEDFERFLEELNRHDILEYIRQQRPDTKWVVHLLTNVTFYLSKLIHWCQSRPSRPYFEEQSYRCFSWWSQWSLYRQTMLFSMPIRTPWSSRCPSCRSSSQNVLPPVPAVQTDGFQGLPGCVLRRPDGVRAVVQLECICLRPPRNRSW